MQLETKAMWRLARQVALLAVVLMLAGCSSCDDTTDTVDFFEPHEYGEWEYRGEPDIDGPARVSFGEVFEGETVDRQVEVSNVGRNLLKLGGWQVDGPFSLSFPRYGGHPPVELMPGESIIATLTYTATSPTGPAGPVEGTLSVESNDPDEQPFKILLYAGASASPDCPEAVIHAYSPDRGEAVADPQDELIVIPLDDVTLDASLSRDPEGAGISRVAWRLVERPTDSTEQLRNINRTETGLWMQLAGTYVVELDVWNQQGVKSCEPARMTLKAIADQDIHIQLVWSTPGDSDESDDEGSDVDLHLLHPRAYLNWDGQPWDCFWRNKEPNWGDPDSERDDPSLDIDDTDGVGPENINLDNPQFNHTYNVGVHYYEARSLGVSYATVRIYLGGQLTHEVQGQQLFHHQFWHVADIEWPSGRIIEVDRIYEGFP